MNKRTSHRYSMIFIAALTVISAAVLIFFLYRNKTSSEFIAFSEPVDETSFTVSVLEEPRLNAFSDLSVPTWLTKVDDTY